MFISISAMHPLIQDDRVTSHVELNYETFHFEYFIFAGLIKTDAFGALFTLSGIVDNVLLTHTTESNIPNV